MALFARQAVAALTLHLALRARIDIYSLNFFVKGVEEVARLCDIYVDGDLPKRCDDTNMFDNLARARLKSLEETLLHLRTFHSQTTHIELE